MVLRKGSQMEMKHWIPMILALSIIDLIYNTLLMVAIGVIPLTALSPLNDEFIFRKNPEKMINLILSRNPIFGITGSFSGDIYKRISEVGEKIELSRNTSKVKRNELMVKAGFESLTPDFVPVGALRTVLAGPISGSFSLAQFWLLDPKVGGNLNDQEAWEIKNQFVDSMGRMIPIISELPFRMAQQQVLGEKPKPMSIRPIGRDPWNKPYSQQTPSNTQPKPTNYSEAYSNIKKPEQTLQQQATTPIKAPR